MVQSAELTVLKEAVAGLPLLPGVYKMLGRDGKILYIGKAKNLRNRVRNYLELEELSQRIRLMVLSVTAFEYEVTLTEAEALVLEAFLIRKHQPKFNILLKDDKSNPYIMLSTSHPFPAILKHRGALSKKDEFFGPFNDKSATFRLLELAGKLFKLRTCSDEKFRGAKRPCLEYQIKRCTAPCVGLISAESYGEDVARAGAFLSGKTYEIKQDLKRKIQALAEELEFERAAELRDKLRAIEGLLSEETIDFAKFGDVDAVLIMEVEGIIGIEVFSLRSGFSYGGKVFFPERTEGMELSEILSFFLATHYAEALGASLPGKIFVNIPLDSAVSDAIRTKITHAKAGLGKELLDFASVNLEEKITKKRQDSAKIRDNLMKLKELLALPKMPKRIEVYDNSHTSGTNFVGGMVVAGESGFLKGEYRKFNVKFRETIAGDDYGMLREVLTRRFTNAKMLENMPDLVIIDGGLGQFGVARAVFEELGLALPFVCMAKGRDRNAGKEWLYYEEKTFQLPFTSPLLYYLQTLRDEAHRYAITSHRARRDKIRP